MSDSTGSSGSTPSVATSVDQYNSYGLATQGFVWAAISSVSGDWGKGHVKSVNGVLPDSNGNVQSSSISSLDYSGEVNRINADLTAIVEGEEGHRILYDVDYNQLKSYVNTVSGGFESRFESVCSLFPSEASSTNKLADKNYVDEQIRKESPFFRGSWSTWDDVPTDTSKYPEDYNGNRVPKVNDYLVVLDASSLSYSATVNRSIIGKTLAEAVLSLEVGHVLTESDVKELSDSGIETVVIYRTGTWSFSYVGNWETSGKNGWNPEYEISKSTFTQEQWDAINSGITESKLNVFESASALWNQAGTKVSEASGLWNNTYAKVSADAPKWDLVFSSFSSNSSDIAAVNTKVESSSGKWDSAASTLNSNSQKWNNATTEIESTSADNRAVYSTVNSASGNWESTREKVASSSNNWDDVYSTVKTASGKWNESEGSTKAYTDMVGTSALTSAEKYTDYAATSSLTSANVYSTFIASSALTSANSYTDSRFVFVESASGGWDGAYTEVSETSSNYRSAYSTFETASSRWDDAYDTLNEKASTWDSTSTTVASHSAIWDESAGNTKQYTDMIGTSALTSAEKYADGKFHDAGVYAEFVSTSALTSAEEYANYKFTDARDYSEFMATSALTAANKHSDDSDATIYVAFRKYSNFTAASSLSAANEYTDAKVASVSGDIASYSEFTAASALSTALDGAYAYSDITALALSGNLSSYSETVAASALSDANVYTRFAASSALTSAFGYTDSVSSALYESLSGSSESFAASALSSAISYTDSVTSQINKTVTYVVPFDSNDGIDEYSQKFENPINGDVIVLKKELFEGATENYRFISFTYCSGEWHAMDGDYDAKNVFFSENLTTTVDVGTTKVDPSVGYAVINSKGKSITAVFGDIFKEEKDPEVTLPYIKSVSTESLSAFESGTILRPKIVDVETCSGSYSYGPESQSYFDSIYATIGNQTVQYVKGVVFGSITLTDAMSSEDDSRRISVRGHYTTDTVIPVDNLGNLIESKAITEGYAPIVYSDGVLISYRQCFFEARADNTNVAMITSLFVRSLANKTGCYPSNGYTFKIEFPVGAKSIVLAVPKSAANGLSITDGNILGMNVLTAFDSYEAEVKDAGDRNAIPYMVYWKNVSESNDTSNTYTVKFEE